jgi:hypothetical protein
MRGRCLVLNPYPDLDLVIFYDHSSKELFEQLMLLLFGACTIQLFSLREPFFGFPVGDVQYSIAAGRVLLQKSSCWSNGFYGICTLCFCLLFCFLSFIRQQMLCGRRFLLY